MTEIVPKYHVLQGEINGLGTEATHAHYLNADEGDPVIGFIMLVAGQSVHGNFWKATFKDGDHVQVIGQERHGIFEAVAVTKPEERIIWMQPHCERGTQSQKRNLLKCSGWAAVFGYTCAVLLGTFGDMPLWFMLFGFSIAIPLLLFFTVGLSWKDFMSFSAEMNAVGVALDLPEPEKIDLFKSTKLARQNGKPDLPMGVYYY